MSASQQPPDSHALLTGTVRQILTHPNGVWAEIVIEGGQDLYREIRVPNPMHNTDGSIVHFNASDRVCLSVTLAEPKSPCP